MFYPSPPLLLLPSPTLTSSFSAPATSTIPTYILSIFSHLHGFYDTFVACSPTVAYLKKLPSSPPPSPRAFILRRRDAQEQLSREEKATDEPTMHDEIRASFRPLPFELCVCIGMRVSEFLKGARCPPPRLAHNAPVNHPGARQKAEFSGKKSVTATTYYGCKGLSGVRFG